MFIAQNKNENYSIYIYYNLISRCLGQVKVADIGCIVCLIFPFILTILKKVGLLHW